MDILWSVTLAANLVTAAMLCRAHTLGLYSCTCDVGLSGNEWKPGCGVTPEAIRDRRWTRYYDHDFLGTPSTALGEEGLFRCVRCGEAQNSISWKYNRHNRNAEHSRPWSWKEWDDRDKSEWP
jgi:hypothetical protein